MHHLLLCLIAIRDDGLWIPSGMDAVDSEPLAHAQLEHNTEPQSQAASSSALSTFCQHPIKALARGSQARAQLAEQLSCKAPKDCAVYCILFKLNRHAEQDRQQNHFCTPPSALFGE